MPQKPPCPPPPAGRPVAQHVRDAIARPLQAKLQAPALPTRQPAPHVQAALGAVQPKRAHAPTSGLRAVQAKLPVAPPQRPNTVPHRAVIQRASQPEYAVALVEESKDNGARLASKEKEWIDLDSVKRTYFGWFSKKILQNLGVGARPASGSTCPMCNNAGASFELDHMTPWRHYIAAFSGRELVKKKKGTWLIRGDAAKALYNDPNNLWWICRDCNNPKSDIIPENKDHASGDFSSGTYGRSAGPPSGIMDEGT
jgi:hypothetical protein